VRADSQVSNDNRRQPFITESVSLEYTVMGNNPKFFYTGLGHQHSIERIPMDRRQTAGRHRMLEPNRQWPKAVLDDRVFQIIQFNLETTQCRFDGRLPNRGSAHEHVVVGTGNDLAGFLAKFAVIGQPPEKDMGIEKQTHGLGLAFERSQELFWKRRVKVFLDANLAAHDSGPADGAFCQVRN